MWLLGIMGAGGNGNQGSLGPGTTGAKDHWSKGSRRPGPGGSLGSRGPGPELAGARGHRGQSQGPQGPETTEPRQGSTRARGHRGPGPASRYHGGQYEKLSLYFIGGPWDHPSDTATICCAAAHLCFCSPTTFCASRNHAEYFYSTFIILLSYFGGRFFSADYFLRNCIPPFFLSDHFLRICIPLSLVVDHFPRISIPLLGLAYSMAGPWNLWCTAPVISGIEPRGLCFLALAPWPLPPVNSALALWSLAPVVVGFGPRGPGPL